MGIQGPHISVTGQAPRYSGQAPSPQLETFIGVPTPPLAPILGWHTYRGCVILKPHVWKINRRLARPLEAGL